MVESVEVAVPSAVLRLTETSGAVDGETPAVEGPAGACSFSCEVAVVISNHYMALLSAVVPFR